MQAKRSPRSSTRTLAIMMVHDAQILGQDRVSRITRWQDAQTLDDTSLPDTERLGAVSTLWS